MADKKMTELQDLGAGIAAGDILHVVDDPLVAPVNKQVTVENFVGNLNKTVGATEGAAGKSGVKSTLTTGALASPAYGTLTPLETTLTASAAAEHTNVYGAKITAKMSSASSNLTLATGEAAGLYAELDLTDGITNVGGKTYGLIVKMNDSNKSTTARATTPSAMIKLSDDTFDAITSSPEESAAHTATVQHLADLGNVHMTTNSDYWTTSDKGMVFKSSNTVTTTEIASGTHKIRVKVNGSDMFLLAVANGHSTF
tara:strand:- start:52 stop:819 length:768 start_codon:yes stop_codon:yes gene_type:complete